MKTGTRMTMVKKNHISGHSLLLFAVHNFVSRKRLNVFFVKLNKYFTKKESVFMPLQS